MVTVIVGTPVVMVVMAILPRTDFAPFLSLGLNEYLRQLLSHMDLTVG